MARRLYVANSGEDSISVISVASRCEITRIPLLRAGCGPRRLAVMGSVLYRADTFSNTVGRFPMERPHVQTEVSVGACPTDIAVDAWHVYVACGESNSLWKVNRRHFVPELCVATGAFPIGVAAKGDELAVAELMTGHICVHSIADLEKTAEYASEGMPLWVASCSRGWLCGGVTGDGKGVVTLFCDGKTAAIPLSRPVSKGVVFFQGEREKAVLAHVWDDGLSFVELTEDGLKLTGHARCGRMPDELCVDQAEGVIYVSCMMEDAVEAFSFDGEKICSMRVGSEPRGLSLW